MHDHQGHTAEPGHAHEAELFPRQLTSELVGVAEARAERREWGAVLGFTLALGSVALAWPIESLWGNLATVPARAMGFAPLSTSVGWAARGIGTQSERLWYLLGALGYALTLPALVSLLRAQGVTTRTALGLSLCVLLAPLPWLAARLPSAFGLHLLSTTWLAQALLAKEKGADNRLRYGALWLLALLVHPQALLLLPALAYGLGKNKHPQQEQLRQRNTGFWLALCCACGLVLLFWLRSDSARAAFVAALCPGHASSSGRLLAWLGLLLLGLPSSVLGSCLLCFSKRAPEEGRAPGWLRLWLLAAVVPLACADARAGPQLAWLVVSGAVGLGDWLNRRAYAESASRLLLLGLALQLCLSALTLQVLAPRLPQLAPWAGDTTLEWRKRAQEFLQPEDLVLTDEAAHAYLLRERYGLPLLDFSGLSAGAVAAFSLPELSATLAQRQGRVIVDSKMGGKLRTHLSQACWSLLNDAAALDFPSD